MKGEILPPLTASLNVKPAGWRFGLRLWLPLFLLWLLALPFLVLALPFLLFAGLIFGVRFWPAIRAVLGLLAALRGTRVEVTKPASRIFLNLH